MPEKDSNSKESREKEKKEERKEKSPPPVAAAATPAAAPALKPQPRDVHARLREQLLYLGLTRVADTYKDLLAQAHKVGQSPLDFLDAVIADESAARFDRRVRRRIARARFPVTKTIESYDWTWPTKIDRQRIIGLFDLDFIDSKRNAVFVGGTGIGKTHIAIALAIAACQRGRSVVFRTAMELVNELAAAQTDSTFLRKLRFFTQPELLVIDELGYLPIDKLGADLLFQVVSQRYERGSIVLTTNRIPKDWDKVFNDATVASAVLDRLAHHSEMLVLEGKSFRTERDRS
jgi:DNA replication protein DnaC